MTVVSDFRALIDATDKRTEKECAQVLAQNAPEFLTNRASITPKTVHVHRLETEYKLQVGRCDAVIVGKVDNHDGTSTWTAWVWEFKAPQLAAFEEKTQSRYGATADLCEAEEQLFHYVDELKISGVPLGDGTRVEARNIRPGGIVIGCERLTPKDPAKLELYTRARSIRKEMLYDRNVGMEIASWDRVYQWIARPKNLVNGP